MNASEFEKVAGWCGKHLREQHGPEVAEAFVQLLETLRQLAEISRADPEDRFDDRRSLEQQVDRLLGELGSRHAASLGQRHRGEHASRAAEASSSGKDGPRTTRLFVYGTLKRGFSRAGALARQRFLGVARTLPAHRLYDCGGYPGLVEDPQGIEIAGELWEVDAECLARLDQIEGVPQNLYRRGTLRLKTGLGEIRTADTYFYQRSVQGLRDCGESWP